ncbi:zinc finger protein 419-like [Cylas formicarius]|uniref:zinc finger protein 419-like n=1 Tax=Cylas formicarius TaxID=197179 RepID=UPI0029589224|nr:zinc finger protein 419-like [Cylas formicarius]
MQFAQDRNGRFMCPNCNSSYKQKGHLVRHIKYECGVEPKFQCQVCYRRFKHKSNLKAHYIFLHKTVFNCIKCGKTYTLYGMLQKHRMISICGPVRKVKCFSSYTIEPLGPLPSGSYGCVACGKFYKHCSGLTRHVKECGREKSLKCAFCSHRTHRRDSLKSHMLMKHNASLRLNQPSLSCPKCGNTFTRLDNLRRHVKFICGVKPQFKCSYCPYASKHKYVLALHIKSRHGDYLKSERY